MIYIEKCHSTITFSKLFKALLHYKDRSLYACRHEKASAKRKNLWLDARSNKDNITGSIETIASTSRRLRKLPSETSLLVWSGNFQPKLPWSSPQLLLLCSEPRWKRQMHDSSFCPLLDFPRDLCPAPAAPLSSPLFSNRRQMSTERLLSAYWFP